KAKAIINNNIAALKANPSLRIVVEGNTDSMGPSAYNLRLSEKRAKSVYNYLKKNGITDKQIQGINSNGEKLPKKPNTVDGRDNPKGRKENRRVDFTIVGS
ncbi:MAG: OmpA family protein, partial [Crocinitomicaceae bacterium]